MKMIFFILVLICISQSVSFGQNVGIGTTTPGTTLVVSKDVSSGGGILRLLNNSGVNLVSWIGFSHEDANGSADNSDRARIGCVVQNSGNGHLFFSTGGMDTQEERMRITDNGNVGIGIISPANKLDINGALAIGANFSGTAAPTNGAIIEGPVGIGTTSPAHKLEVRGNIWLGVQQPGTGFTTIQDVLYLGSPRKYLSNTLGAAIDGSDDWINLMTHPFSNGIMFGLSGPSDTDPHSVPVPLMVIRSSGNAGIGTAIPNNSAKLDINSTTQGFLPPRMTYNQRNAINSPAQGLTIYCTDCGIGELQSFNGFSWYNMVGGPASTPIVLNIGDDFGGGKVAYILQSGDHGYIPGQVHGLIAAAGDQSTGIIWGCAGVVITGGIIDIGYGQISTTAVINQCIDLGIAARLCDDLVLNGYSDWFLPSLEELRQLYSNQVAIGNFIATDYWSANVFETSKAWSVNFSTGNYGGANRNLSLRVRAVRAF